MPLILISLALIGCLITGFYFAKKDNPFPKGEERVYDCKCGKKITVVVNKYDNSNSGIGRCECGATMYVN